MMLQPHNPGVRREGSSPSGSGLSPGTSPPRPAEPLAPGARLVNPGLCLSLSRRGCVKRRPLKASPSYESKIPRRTAVTSSTASTHQACQRVLAGIGQCGASRPGCGVFAVLSGAVRGCPVVVCILISGCVEPVDAQGGWCQVRPVVVRLQAGQS